MAIHDISMDIHPDMLVYPGNPAPRIDRYKRIAFTNTQERSNVMPIILWLLGVPLSLVIILWLFGVF